MAEPTVVDVLRELLVREQRGLSGRLLESTVFVSDLAVDDMNTVMQMARAGEKHCAWLTELILSLGGVPGLRGADMTSADLHYQALQNVLPRLVEDRESLAQLYSQAARHVADEPRAADLVSRILSRHQEELRSVRQLSEQPRTPAD